MLRNEFSKKMNNHNIRENTNMGDLRFLRPFIHKSKSSECNEGRNLDSFRDVENLLRNTCGKTGPDTILMQTSPKQFHSHQNVPQDGEVIIIEDSDNDWRRRGTRWNRCFDIFRGNWQFKHWTGIDGNSTDEFVMCRMKWKMSMHGFCVKF